MYLFIGADGQKLDKSINYQLAHSELWNKLASQSNTITSSNDSEDTGNTGQDPTLTKINSGSNWQYLSLVFNIFKKYLGLSALVENLGSSVPNPTEKASRHPHDGTEDHTATKTDMVQLPMPPPVGLPQVCRCDMV